MQITIYKRRTGEMALKACLVTELVCVSDDLLVVQSPQAVNEGIEDMYFVDIGSGADEYMPVRFDQNKETKPPYTLVGRFIPTTRR
jgi:hypothetical protein